MLNNFFHRKLSGVALHTWLLLFVICVIGYWPISSNLFSLKNDAYVYFLPCRYFISECIQSGHLPLWSNYFYMGFPMHGDMQSGAWNPIVIFISLFGKYNMTTLQLETLLYVFIAGLGMYKLLGIIAVGHRTKIIVAASYMFCGFIIDTGQITVWTGSAAFIPFVFLYYYRILYEQQSTYKNALKTALALYFLLTAGYPSFLIMCCYILFISLIVFCLAQVRKKNFSSRSIFMLLKANALVAIAFLLISLPALLSYLDYFPYYQRSSGTSLQQAQENPFNPFAIISYLFPLSVTRAHTYLTTNPTARSGYIGLFTLIVLAGFFKKELSGLQKLILAMALFTFFFSMGNALPVRKFCYDHLPLMNLFRHPGTMRLFTTIGLLVLSSYYLDDLFIALQNKKNRYYLWLCAATVFLISVVMLLYLNNSSLPGKIALLKQSVSSPGNIRVFLKEYYDNFSFADAIVLEGLVQVFFLLAFFFLIRKNVTTKIDRIAALFILNPILLAQFSIPSTFVTGQSPSLINHFIKTSPANYPVPDLNDPISKNNAVEKQSNRRYGCASFYKKKIVLVEDEINPSFTKSLGAFEAAKAISSIVLQYPVCYFADTMVHYRDSMNIVAGSNKILFADDTTVTAFDGDTRLKSAGITITQFAPWALFFETNTPRTMPFVLFQNFNKNWKLFVDRKSAVIKKGNISFMYADIEKGRHVLQFYYRPSYINYSIALSLFTLLAIMFFLTWNRKRKTGLNIR